MVPRRGSTHPGRRWPEASVIVDRFERPLASLVGIFTSLGVGKVRLTGGEPLLRHDLPALAAMLTQNRDIRDLALTTNGLLLARSTQALKQAGLGRVTVSLDTLRPERMQALARSDRHADVLAGIAAARGAGFPMKLNTVVMRGVDDCAVLPFLRPQPSDRRWDVVPVSLCGSGDRST